MSVSDGTGTLSNQLPFNVTSAPSFGHNVVQRAEVITAPRSVASGRLLFPFTTNQLGYDTEITLSNTSLDTVGSSSVAGSCALSYYGAGTPSPQTQTSFVIAPGAQLVFNLSKGGGGMPGAPGFQGYIIAACNFPLVRGWAKVWAQSATLAQAQEAQVLTLPRTSTTPQVLTFPYVTNQLGFDTGVAIANTSSDPFGASGATASAGTCTLSFYGTGAPSQGSITTPNVPSGTVYTQVLSGVAAGFQGYVIASCNFTAAAGFAFVTNGVGANGGTSLAEAAELGTLPRTGTVKPLLFTGLTNQNGKDTGIAIANTSTDPFGVSGSTPGSGTCTLNLYGSGAPNSITTPNIASGTVYTTVLSAIAPGFEGYATASCNFAQARGYSFVTSGLGKDGDGLTAEIVITPRSFTASPLLFPTVTNWTGTDTNISIWNTSSDPFGTSPAGGTCTISYYGSMLGGGAVPANQTSTFIAAGGQLSFSISQGNGGQGIAATPGFRGYLIAACTFPQSRGAATITGTTPLLQITTTSVPGGSTGNSYAAGLGASGGAAPYTNWTVVSGGFPAGLTLNSVTGAITGTPVVGSASATPYSFSVTTRDAAGTTSSPVSLSILTSAGAGVGVITGAVQWNGTPIPSSPVELKAVGNYNALPVLASTATAADGTFSLSNVPAGQYAVYAVAPTSEYWAWTSRSATVTAGQTINVGTFSLSKILQLNSPANSSTGVTTTPTLQWTAFPGATTYTVQVFNNSTSVQVFIQSTGATQVAVSPALANGTQYQWSVYANNANGQIAYYSAWYFTTLGSNPNPVLLGFANAADFSAPPLAPGSQASIFGTNLAASTAVSSTLPWSTSLAGTSMTVNGVLAPLNFVSSSNINFQIPYATPASGTANVVLTNNGLVSNTFQLAMAPAAPGLYTNPAVQNVNGLLNSSQNPAAPGTFVIAYLTGLGAVNPAASDGVAATGVASPVAAYSATFAGQPASLAYLGLSPGAVGQGQANLQIPAGLATGGYPLVITVGGRSSGAATIYVGTNSLSISTGTSLGTWTTGNLQLGLVATGGDGNFVWNYVSGTLPPGVSLRTDVGPSNFSNGPQAGLLGIATTPGTYTYTLSVTSAGQTVNRTFTMRVTALNVKDVAVSLPDAFANTPYSYAFSAVGTAGQVTFTATSTAGPVTLSTGGTLSGTPVAPGTYTIGFTLNDTVDTTFRSFNYTVYAVNLTSPGLLPNAVQNVPYNVGLTASGGSGGYTYAITSGGFPSGLALSAGGAIAGTTGNVGRYVIYVKVTDSSGAAYTKQLSIFVSGVPAVLPQLISYGNFDDAVLGNGYSRGIAVNIGGTAPFMWSATGLPAGMSIRTGSGVASNYIAPVDAEVWGVPQVFGDYVAQITATDAIGVSTTTPFAFRVSQLDETPTLPSGTVNTAYSSSVRALGGSGPYTVRIVPQVGAVLPAGLTLNTNSLQATGTPIETGGFNTVLEFTDSAGHKLARTNSYNIAGTNSSNISINNASSLGTAAVGASYSLQLTACCVASYTWSQAGGTLPSGTTLTSGGLLSGPLSAAGTYNFLIKAADASNAQNVAFRQFTLVVSASPLTISTGSLPNGTFQVAYNQTLAATGGSGTLTWALNYLNYMPPGLSLASNGAITGTPASLGNYAFTVLVTDGAGVTVSRSLGISVSLNNNVITFPQPADTALTAGPVTLTATATSGLPVTYTSNSAAVCTVSGASVTLVSAGVCSVTANQAGNGTFAVAVAAGRLFTVQKGAQTINFTQPADTPLSAGPVTLTAAATSGLAVSFTSNSTPFCTVSGSGVTLVGVGTCSITANQAGNANYNAATAVTRTFNVTQVLVNPAVTLAVGDGSGFAGDTVEIPITLTSAGTPALSTFQTDLNFDPQKLTFKSARAGAQLTAAGKSLSTSAQPNGDLRFLAVGFNQNVIANGIVAYATFTLGGAFSSGVVTPKACTSADAQGNIIVTACTAGTIKLPTCDINADGTINVADVQLIINEALGVSPAIHDLNHDGAVNVADVQKVINAALGLGCSVQ